MAKEKKNLYQKLLTVMEAVDRVEKRGRNEFHKYDYVLEADLIEAVRKTLIEEGVFVFASVVEERTSTAGTEDKPKQITSVKTKYKFVNVDNPEESEEVLGFGQGEDQGDKGGYKAITGAMKYFLMKTFLILKMMAKHQLKDQKRPPNPIVAMWKRRKMGKSPLKMMKTKKRKKNHQKR